MKLKNNIIWQFPICPLDKKDEIIRCVKNHWTAKPPPKKPKPKQPKEYSLRAARHALGLVVSKKI